MAGTPEKSRVRAMLAGGEPRSLGRAQEVASLVLAGTLPFGALFAAMFDEDALVQWRAADAVEKVSAERPEWLRAHKAEFLARLSEFQRPEMRWHRAQMLPRLDLTTAERDTFAVPALLDDLWARGSIVRTCALQALADLAAADAGLRPRVIGLLEEAIRTGTPAMRARSRVLRAKLASLQP